MKDRNTAEAPVEPVEIDATKDSECGPGGEVSGLGFPRMLTDRYRLERLIAKGGMGRVYLATQLPLERKVALKHLVRPSLNEDFRRRFFLEASVLARLSHRNIVVVHDYGEAPDGSLFMAMEHLDGTTLLDTLRREGRLPAKRAVEITIQVCRALRSAHKQGVAHRDLKPGNIMLLCDSEESESEAYLDIVKVLDFGLVKVFQEDHEKAQERDLTHAEMMLGSPRYMAPEQIQSGHVDARSDVYSLGVVFFAMLTGRPPYIGTTLEILNQHIESEIPGINELTQRLKGFDAVDPEYEPTLSTIVFKCMFKDPAGRYQSMDELLLDLRTTYRLLIGDAVEGASQLDVTQPSLARRAARTAPSTPAPAATLPNGANAEASHQRLRSGLGSIDDRATIPDNVKSKPRRSRAWLYISAALILCFAVASAFGVWFVIGHLSSSRQDQGALSTAPQDLPVTTPAVPERLRSDVSFTSSPAGARVVLDGQTLGTTPLQHQLDRDANGSDHLFTFLLDGFQPAEVRTVIASKAPVVHADLIASPQEDLPPEETESATSTHSKKRGAAARRRWAERRRSERSGGNTVVAEDGSDNSHSKTTDTASSEQRNTQADSPSSSEREQPAKLPDRSNRLLVDEQRSTVPIVD